jgi:hypothetical protein
MMDWQAFYADKRARKECQLWCNNPALPGYRKCADHVEYARRDNNANNSERKERYFAKPEGRAKRQARVAKRRGVWYVQYDFQIICAQYEYRCFYRFPGCEDYVRGEYMLTQDHVISVYHGGPSMAFNILPACRPCNSYKKHRWLTELPFDPYNRIADPNLLIALAAKPDEWSPKLLVPNTKAYNEWLDSQL